VAIAIAVVVTVATGTVAVARVAVVGIVTVVAVKAAVVGIVTVVAVKAAVVGIVTAGAVKAAVGIVTAGAVTEPATVTAGAVTEIAAVTVAPTVTAVTIVVTTAVVTSPVVVWSRSKTSLSPVSTTDRKQHLDERVGLRAGPFRFSGWSTRPVGARHSLGLLSPCGRLSEEVAAILPACRARYTPTRITRSSWMHTAVELQRRLPLS
jgi:hypothetical protein